MPILPERPGLAAGALLFALLPAQLPAAGDIDQTRSSLQQVDSHLQSQQQQLQQTRQAHQQALDKLKPLEQHIGQLASQLHHSRQSLAKLDSQQQALQRRQQVIQARQKEQQQALAALLDAAYRRGQHDTLRMLLEGSAAQNSRHQGYWHYLNQARQQALDELQQLAAEQADTARQLADNRQQSQQLYQQQQAQHRELSEQKNQQQVLVTQLAAQRQSQHQQLGQLQQQQQSLQQALAQALARQAAEAQARREAQAREAAEARRQAEQLARQNRPLDGLKADRGRLPWPVKARVRHAFDSPRQGSVRWQGVMLAAAEGDQVKAIGRGEVLFADWMRGFGLVLVLDHGQDYLSLYAHNQSLLRKVGERVEAGEPIALVGRSGGSRDAGLYFEIRHQGSALDPARWCHRG